MCNLFSVPLLFTSILLFVSIQDAVFFVCGDSLNSKGMTYLTNSLFDYRSPENNGVRAEFILDASNHKVSIKSEGLFSTKDVIKNYVRHTEFFYVIENKQRP